jgi:hypothetical protein
MGEISRKNPNYKKMRKVRDLFLKKFPKSNSILSGRSLISKSKESIRVSRLVSNQDLKMNNCSNQLSQKKSNSNKTDPECDMISINIYKNKKSNSSKKQANLPLKLKEKSNKNLLQVSKNASKIKENKKKDNQIIYNNKKEKSKPTVLKMKSKTLKNFPIINKSSLSFVSVKDNNYYKKLKQEKFPTVLRKILPQGMSDSFITYADPYKNLSMIKKSFHSNIKQDPMNYLSKSKIHKSKDKKGLITDLDSYISDNKYSQILKNNLNKNKNVCSFSILENDISDIIEPKKFLYTKKKTDKDSMKYSKKVDTDNNLKKSSFITGVNNTKTSQNRSVSQVQKELKEIINQTKKISDSNSNIALNSCYNSYHSLKSSIVQQESKIFNNSSSTKSKKNILNSNKQGYLDLGSKNSSSESIKSISNSTSDWKFGGSSSREKNISSSEISIKFSEKCKMKLKSKEKIIKIPIETGSLKIKNDLELTETKPETNDSKNYTLLDLTNPSNKVIPLIKSPNSSYLQMKSTIEIEGGNIMNLKDNRIKPNFVKSQKIQELLIDDISKTKSNIEDEKFNFKFSENTDLSGNYFKKKSLPLHNSDKENKEMIYENIIKEEKKSKEIQKETETLISQLEKQEEEVIKQKPNEENKSYLTLVNQNIIDNIIENVLRDSLWANAILSKTVFKLSN